MTREERLKLREERRLRRRKRLDNMLSSQITAVLCLLVIILAVLLIVIPRSKTSAIEKRDLAAFPKFSISTLLSGEFTRGVQTYYDDTVPFRDSFKNLNNSMKNLFGLHSEGTAEIVGNVNKVTDTAPTQTEAPAQTQPEETAQIQPEETAAAGTGDTVSETAAAPAETGTDTAAPTEKKNYEKGEADGTFNNGFLIVSLDGHWRGLPLFAGGDYTEYTDFMNTLADSTGDNVRVYAMPVPLASEYYLPSNFSDYSVSQRDAIEEIMSMLSGSVTGINLIDVLGAHENEDIFMRTDHHWSQLGAYYAGQALAQAAGVPYADLASYGLIQREGYIGSMYGYTQSANLLNDPETFTLMIPSAPYSNMYHDTGFNFTYEDDLFLMTDLDNSYLAYIGGDMTPVHVRTAQTNGRKLLIIKDSYGNPLPSLLTGSFEEIFTIDLRFCDFNLLNFINSQGITDIVTAFSIDTAAYPSADLLGLLTQYSDSGIPNDEPQPEPPAVTPLYEAAVSGRDPLLVE